MMDAAPYSGWKQRAAAAGLSGDSTRESSLARELIHDATAGTIPFTFVQRYARSAVNDGLSHSSLQKLANMGDDGKLTYTRFSMTNMMGPMEFD